MDRIGRHFTISVVAVGAFSVGFAISPLLAAEGDGGPTRAIRFRLSRLPAPARIGSEIELGVSAKPVVGVVRSSADRLPREFSIASPVGAQASEIELEIDRNGSLGSESATSYAMVRPPLQTRLYDATKHDQSASNNSPAHIHWLLDQDFATIEEHLASDVCEVRVHTDKTRVDSTKPERSRRVDVVDEPAVARPARKSARRTKPTRIDEVNLESQSRSPLSVGLKAIKSEYERRARVVEELRTQALAQDLLTGSGQHVAAFLAGYAAYEEAGDFVLRAKTTDLKEIMAGHQTAFLKQCQIEDFSPQRCVQEYLAYAENQFSKAVGTSPRASIALYRLGRLEASSAAHSVDARHLRAVRSLMLYQASVRADAANFAAANELAVILAHYGRYESALKAMQHCVEHCPDPVAWRNLASIYERLGRTKEAASASEMASRPPSAIIPNRKS